MALEFAQENIWYDKWRVEDAERQFYEKKFSIKDCRESDVRTCTQIDTPSAAVSSCAVKKVVDEGGSGLGSLANQIALARQEIQNSLAYGGRGSSASAGGASPDVLNRITKLEGENVVLTKKVQALEQTIATLTKLLESLKVSQTPASASSLKKPDPKKPEPKEAVEDDDDEEIDLFGSDSEEEDANAARVREERLKAYAEKKSKKPGPIAKSSVLLDCKPWDDETDMKAMENEIRKIEMDGLIWGAAKLVPLAFGIMKLSILCTVEDEKVSVDDLCEKIQEIEDYVQSVDVAAFNKI